MKSLLAFSVIMAFWVPASVHGAKCSTLTSSTCEVTDFTLATCDSTTKVCGCMTGYVPIKSGCAKKLAKPMITVPAGRTKEVVKGGDATLTCTTSSDLTGLTGVEYEWKKGTTVASSKTSITYDISAADGLKVGDFSCKVKYNNPDGVALDSEESDTVTIALIDDGTDGMVAATRPVLSNLPTKAADGVTLYPTCIDIPMGAAYTFVYDDDTPAADPLIFNSDARGKAGLKCKMTAQTYFTYFESQVVNLPTLATDIDGAVIMASAVGTDYVYKTGNSGPAITCSSSPEAQYMGAVTYEFQVTVDNNSPTTISTNPYTPDSVTGTAKKELITCSATFDTNSAKTSTTTVTVDFRDDYITTPVLTASGTALVAGSRLVLTCGDAQDGVMYSWTVSAAAIVRQFDRIIQIDNFQSGDAGNYQCTATKNNYVAPSESVSISLSTTITTTVQKTHDGTTFGEDGDYTLKCFTTSATAGMVYAWKKDTTDLMTTTSTYEIMDASATKHNGTYTCTASFNNIDSTTMNGLVVSVVAAGKECAANSDCTGLGAGYTGTCNDMDPKRCECAKNYVMKGDICKSHATTMIGSAILVIAAAILSRLV